jgi:maltooligosyltrehalose trehalohydrolase
MLFQGEEWAASTPFQFFTSHPEPELGRMTLEGRVDEFARMGWDVDLIPDPQDPATFERSRLDWSELDEWDHAEMLVVYQRLAELRRALPELTDPSFHATTATADTESRLFRMTRGRVEILVNFGDEPQSVDAAGDLLFATGEDVAYDDGRVALPAHAGALVARSA